MIDDSFRKHLPSYTGWLVKIFLRLRVTPNQLTVFSFVFSLSAAFAVVKGSYLQALLLWWLGRLLDGTDGIYARHTKQESAFGAFLDILLDMASYSVMVVAFSIAFPQYAAAWNITLFLYVLCITGALALGSLEDKARLPTRDNRGLRLAAGLAEGGETGIAYTVFLLFPKHVDVTIWIWIGILAVTVLSRIFLAYREFSPSPSDGSAFERSSAAFPCRAHSKTSRNPDT